MFPFEQIVFINGRVPPPFFQGGDGVYIRNLLEFLHRKYNIPIITIGSAASFPNVHNHQFYLNQIKRHRFKVITESPHFINYQVKPNYQSFLFTNDDSFLSQGISLLQQCKPNSLILTQLNYSHKVIQFNATYSKAPIVHFVHDTHELNALSLEMHESIDLIAFNSNFTQQYFNHKHLLQNTCVSYPSILHSHRSKPASQKAILFVNPIETKGAHLVSEIIRQLPDKQFLIQNNYDRSLNNIFQFQNCTILPRRYDMSQTYKKAKLILIPSISEEPFGLIAIEAASFGIPIIAHNTGGLSEAVQNYGVLLPPKSPSEIWINAIKAFDDQRFYAEYQQNARNEVSAFSVQNQWTSLYNELKKYI